MATRRAVAVLKIKRPTDYKSVLSRTSTVVTSMTTAVAIYALPDPPLATLTAQAAVLQGYVDKVNDGNHAMIDMRNQESETLYRMLQEELIYVNKVGNNDRGLLAQSGFEVSDDPNPRPIPVQVIIKRIEKGEEPNNAKIVIIKMDQTMVEFIVQTTITPATEDSWKTVLIESNSHNLILEHLVPGQEIWIRICAKNTTGSGLWSLPISYFPQR